jgi:hypothetical protein
MHDYTVVEVGHSGAQKTLCLEDEAGAWHVATAIAAVPRVGTRLLGNSPALGFGLLLGAPLDEVFRVVFEVVHCSRAEASCSLRGALTP